MEGHSSFIDHPIFFWLVTILVLAAIFGIIGLFTPHPVDIQSIQEITMPTLLNTTTKQKINSSISLREWTGNRTLYATKPITIVAYVSKKVEQNGNIIGTNYIASDDFDDEIVIMNPTIEVMNIITNSPNGVFLINGDFLERAPFDKQKRAGITITSLVPTSKPFIFVDVPIIVISTKLVNITVNSTVNRSYIDELFDKYIVTESENGVNWTVIK